MSSFSSLMLNAALQHSPGVVSGFSITARVLFYG